jgi:hypothetical protein
MSVLIFLALSSLLVAVVQSLSCYSCASVILKDQFASITSYPTVPKQQYFFTDSCLDGTMSKADYVKDCSGGYCVEMLIPIGNRFTSLPEKSSELK